MVLLKLYVCVYACLRAHTVWCFDELGASCTSGHSSRGCHVTVVTEASYIIESVNTSSRSRIEALR